MLRLIFAWVVLLTSIIAASAQEPTGHTVAVVPDASAFNTSGVRLLSSQQAVFMGDRLQTGPAGEAQLQFIDETKLVVGPGSSLVIDSFIVKENTVLNFALSATRGAFRFFSGTSAKSAYAISTPTVTLGVRGTQFDFTVLSDGATEFVLLHGEVRICDRFGNCIAAARPCTLILAPKDGPLRLLPSFERKQRLEERFPYVTSQEGRLEQPFQTDVSRCSAYANEPGAPIPIKSDGAVRLFSPPRPTSSGAKPIDLNAFNILFPAGLTTVPSVPAQQALLSVAEARLTPNRVGPPVPEPRSQPPAIAVPGPVAGAGLPALAAFISLLWLRRRRTAERRV